MRADFLAGLVARAGPATGASLRPNPWRGRFLPETPAAPEGPAATAMKPVVPAAVAVAPEGPAAAAMKPMVPTAAAVTPGMPSLVDGQQQVLSSASAGGSTPTQTAAGTALAVRAAVAPPNAVPGMPVDFGAVEQIGTPLRRVAVARADGVPAPLARPEEVGGLPRTGLATPNVDRMAARVAAEAEPTQAEAIEAHERAAVQPRPRMPAPAAEGGAEDAAIQISIGRIEWRAATPAPAPARAEAPPATTGFAEYRALRAGLDRGRR